MKKILLGLSVFCVALISAQNYPDYYPTNSANSGYYGNNGSDFYFPDDYYYDFPADYYTDQLYESYYNDYRRSIYDVNWNRFFKKYRLSPWQVQQIILLNERFPTFIVWNSYYRHNPDRWYYDRFYALERIMGPRIFVVFKNNYYRGYSPIVYFQNYRRQHYVTNIYVVPRYRNININRYKIDRTVYHQNTARTNFGFDNTPRLSTGNSSGNGFRTDATLQPNSNNDGFRTGKSPIIRDSQNANNGGFRTGSGEKNQQVAPNAVTPRNDNGVRNNDRGMRTSSQERKMERNPANQQKVSPRNQSPSATKNTSGLRFTTR